MKTGTFTGNLELYNTGEATTVNIGGRTVPIEYELSSALAYTLEGSQAIVLSYGGFSPEIFLFSKTRRDIRMASFSWPLIGRSHSGDLCSWYSIQSSPVGRDVQRAFK